MPGTILGIEKPRKQKFYYTEKGYKELDQEMGKETARRGDSNAK